LCDAVEYNQTGIASNLANFIFNTTTIYKCSDK